MRRRRMPLRRSGRAGAGLAAEQRGGIAAARRESSADRGDGAAQPPRAARRASPRGSLDLADRRGARRRFPFEPAPGQTASLPPQKGAGEPDLAYGAFQRGFYLTAFALAIERAEKGDPAAADADRADL